MQVINKNSLPYALDLMWDIKTIKDLVKVRNQLVNAAADLVILDGILAEEGLTHLLTTTQQD